MVELLSSRPQGLNPGLHRQHHVCHLPCNLKRKPTEDFIHTNRQTRPSTTPNTHSAHRLCVLAIALESRSQQLSTARGQHTCLLTAQHALQAGRPPKMQAQHMHLPICGRKQVQAGVVCQPAPLCVQLALSCSQADANSWHLGPICPANRHRLSSHDAIFTTSGNNNNDNKHHASLALFTTSLSVWGSMQLLVQGS